MLYTIECANSIPFGLLTATAAEPPAAMLRDASLKGHWPPAVWKVDGMRRLARGEDLLSPLRQFFCRMLIHLQHLCC